MESDFSGSSVEMGHRKLCAKVPHRVDDKSTVFYYGSFVILDLKSVVMRLLTGYSMCLKALILLCFSSQIAVSSAYAATAPVMLSIPTQTIVAEQLFTYRILVHSDTEQSVGVRLINAPDGATLTDNGDSTHDFRWTPPANVGEQTIIIVQAFNVAHPKLISTQRVVLQRGTATQTPAANSITASAAGVVVASNNAIGSRFVTPPGSATSESNNSSTGYTSKFETKPPVSVEADASHAASIVSSTESNSATAASETPASKTNTTQRASSVTPNTKVQSLASQRPELPELELQRLTVGEEFQFFIRPVGAGNAQVQLSAESLPVGASFEQVFVGSKMLRWTPTADQVGEHKMVLVLIAEDETDLSFRTEREVLFSVEPAPPVERAPELSFEPMSAQIVSAGRKVNFRVEPKASGDKIALLFVDRLPAGGSFDENKDGSRTFHWPTTQADQGEHTFRFTAIHPDNEELVASVHVLIVVGSPDGPATGPNNVVASENASPSPELDTYPSADSPAPSPESPASVDSPSPEPYPSADTASPEPLAVRPPPQPKPVSD